MVSRKLLFFPYGTVFASAFIFPNTDPDYDIEVIIMIMIIINDIC